MKLVETAVKRPVGVIMIVIAIIALGVVSFRNLVVDIFPEIDLPVAVVATSYSDAAPQEVENLISKPIEASVSSVEGINTIQSQSQAGSSLVLLMFNNGVDMDQALLDVRERVDQVKSFLPEQSGDPNIMRFSPDQLPVMWVSLTGEDAEQLTNIAEDEIVPYFERQEGVASVQVEGGKEREIQVVLDQSKLQQYGLSPQAVMQAVSSQNSSASVGTIDKGNKDLQLRVSGEYESLDDIGQTVMMTEEGTTLHLEDIAEVKDAIKTSSSETLVNGEPSIVLSIMKKTDSNTVAVSEEVRQAIEGIQGDLADGVDLEVVIDTSEFIQMSIDSVISNILIGGVISLFILLLFLKSFRATLVIGLSIPIAIVSTFTLMYFTGETLNILTLGGLALGLGMMVDSSIVILENIYTYRQRGYNLFDSATKGASELTPAVIASTTTTLVVFLPIVFTDGIASDLFTPLALTVSFSLIASLVVAITLVPMLSSKLLAKAMEDHGRRYWFDRFLAWLTNAYKNLLERALKYRKTTVFSTLLLLVLSIAAVPFIGAEFIPEADQGQVGITIETEPGMSLSYTEEIVEQVNERLESYEDEMETNFVSMGSDAGMMGGGSASYTIQLIPSTERERSTNDIVQAMDEDLESIPGADIKVNAMGMEAGLGNPIQIVLNGPEHEVLRELSEEVVEAIAKVDGVHNPESSATDGTPQLDISIDKDEAAAYGLTQDQVLSQIELQFTGQVISTYRESGREMDISMVYPEDERSTIKDLQDMKIQTPTGSVISLEQISDFVEMQGPVALLRENQQPQMNVTSEIMDRDLGSIVSDVEDTLAGMNLPEGYNYNIGGQAEDMAESFGDLAIALIFSIFLVYAVMAVQFENFLFPFIIMFAMPTAVIGVIAGFLIAGLPLSIPGFIGIIMLAGIVVNTSIILVDYINILRRRGYERHEAIVEAGQSRLRPILMTTMTTILAMVPLGLALGEGAEMQQPLAITIIFGLSFSSLFTLVLVPVIYTYLDNLSARITKRKKKEA